jgi:hypothetical protein
VLTADEICQQIIAIIAASIQEVADALQSPHFQAERERARASMMVCEST